MAERESWNVVVRIDTRDPERPFWHTIGKAWASERNPGSFKILLDSLPLGRDVYLFPNRPADERHEPPKNGTKPQTEESPPHNDDEIPF